MTAAIEAPTTSVADALGVCVSHSQISTFGQCSLKWWLGRVFEPEHVPTAFVFGRAFHSGVETFNRARLEGRTASLEDMLASYDREFNGEPLTISYGKKETKESLRETAERMFAAFLEAAEPSIPLAIEERFRISLADDIPDVAGVIDLVQLRETGEGRVIEVVDYKTAARKPGDDGMPADQLVLYDMAVKRFRALGEFDAPVRLLYRVLTKTKEPACIDVPVEPSEREQRRLVAKYRGCVKAMRVGAVYPNPSWSCSSCQFRSHCAMWPDIEGIQASFPRKAGR